MREGVPKPTSIPFTEKEKITKSMASSSKKELSENQSKQNLEPPQNNRRLGDEWGDWNGEISTENMASEAKKRIFLTFVLFVIIGFNLFLYSCYYLITPRLSQFHSKLPKFCLYLLIAFSFFSLFWYLVLLITSYTNTKLYFLGSGNGLLSGFLLDKVFQLGNLLRYSKDRLGNSFVKVSNAFVKATRKPINKEKILLLLPRCLTKESYSETRQISQDYQVEMAVCTGGEVARQKIKNYRPTAIIAVACERDLVSGIKDVGGKVSVLGITNIRPEGPCKNTQINFTELRSSIQFYLSSK